MSLPDTIKTTPGTPIVCGQPSGSGVTVDLTLNGLADATARMSAVIDFGASWDMDFSVMVVAEPTSAPTAGTGRVDVYIPCTHSTSYYPAGVTGSDGAWPGDSNEDEWALQAGPPVCSLIATNDAATQVQAAVIWRPSGRYGVVIFDNNLGVALKTDGTPANNTSRVIIVPLATQVVD
jgi:hypothetical protein